MNRHGMPVLREPGACDVLWAVGDMLYTVVVVFTGHAISDYYLGSIALDQSITVRT